jgi:hypothetical protein
MGKIITSSFATRKARNHFNNMFCTPLVKLQNRGGEEIIPGEIVQITGRGNFKNEFNLMAIHTGVHIHNIWCEHLELFDKMIIELEDNGQDFLFFHVNQEGKIIDATPFQSEIWKGGSIPTHSMEMLKPGKPCPLHKPPHFNFGYLKHKIKDLKFV